MLFKRLKITVESFAPVLPDAVICRHLLVKVEQYSSVFRLYRDGMFSKNKVNHLFYK